jgi:hypothetical protein
MRRHVTNAPSKTAFKSFQWMIKRELKCACVTTRVEIIQQRLRLREWY